MHLRCPACHSDLRLEVAADLEIVRVAPPVPSSFTARAAAHTETPHVQAMEVVCQVAAANELELSDLRGPSRTKRLVEVRGLAAAAAREATDVSWPQLGRILNRDHSTLIHAVRKVQA